MAAIECDCIAFAVLAVASTLYGRLCAAAAGVVLAWCVVVVAPGTIVPEPRSDRKPNPDPAPTAGLHTYVHLLRNPNFQCVSVSMLLHYSTPPFPSSVLKKLPSLFRSLFPIRFSWLSESV